MKISKYKVHTRSDGKVVVHRICRLHERCYSRVKDYEFPEDVFSKPLKSREHIDFIMWKDSP